MAPPLVKGRALMRRRVSGVLFLVVIALLVQTTVWLYQKRFTPVVDVALQTDSAGNQLSVHADVKLRGILVGEVRSIRSHGDGATLQLALQPGKVRLIPRNVQAQLLPKTLFGEKEVVLVIPPQPSPQRLHAGDVIGQDRSRTAMETQTALTDTLPLLKALHPAELSLVLNELSSSLRDRGDRLGSTMAQQAAYLRRFNPSIPTMGADLQQLATFSDNLAAASPDLLRTLDNLAFSSRSVVTQRAAMDAFLQRTSDFAATSRTFVAQNQARLTALAKDSLPELRLYAHYSPMFPCLLNRIAFSEIEGERVFGGAQPGLHITLEATRDNGGYAPGDEPQYKESRDFFCFGLGPKPIIPFPEYANAQDGYRDNAPPADPGKGPGGCCQAARSWFPAVVSMPSETVVRRQDLPSGTTPLDALLVGVLAGSG